MKSQRLDYRLVSTDQLESFFQLCSDSHIKRFLLDGMTVDRDWCRKELETSAQLHSDKGLGLWFLFKEDSSLIGFAGFKVFQEINDRPQLLYALLGRETGQGFATECARTLTQYALDLTELTQVSAWVDEPNTKSMRVLEKAGFERTSKSMTGSFGPMYEFQTSSVRQ